MTDLRARLEAGLEGTYRIERELGGGGMSRVFVAEELALGRRVVLKVLPPDFSAGLSAERFRREIRLAAGLQHPTVVPLLAAGEANELLYYTMPFVEGESLATRLARDGRVSSDAALPVLRDLADALAYAHRRGVVHRDIKPANVLLSGEHAFVTDFGVAKAVSDATGEIALTGTGLAIGTPAYMAPEQIAADPAADARVDIYALGVLAYEMLAGRSPYGDLPPRSMLAAHVSQNPVELQSVAPGVTPALARLVMRCLEKDPDRRPADGEAVLAELRAASAASPVQARARPRLRTLLLATAAIAAIVIAVVARVISGDASPATLDRNLVAIFPFRVTGAPEQYGEGIVDLLAARLTGEGGPRAADPQSAISAWTRASERNADDAGRLAARLGAARAVIGSIVGIGADRISINAQLIVVDGGRPLAPESVDGPVDSLAWLVDRLAVRLLARGAGEGEARLPDLTTRSPEALRAYLAGQAAYRRGAYAEALDRYEQAVARDSSFALAALAAAASAHWIGEDARRNAAFDVTLRNQHRLAAHDALWMRLRATLIGIPYDQPWRRWLVLADSATRLTPDRAEAWFELGDAYFHEGRALGVSDARDRARAAFARAAELDSGFAAPLEHLVELAAIAGDTAEVRRVAGLYFSVDSTGDLADFVRWRVAAALEDSAGRAAIRMNMRRMTPATLLRIAGTAQLDGIALEDVSPALAAAAATFPAARPALSYLQEMIWAANRGLPGPFDSLLTLSMRAGLPAARGEGIRQGVGLFWLPDTALAARGAMNVRRMLRDAGSTIDDPTMEILCASGIYEGARGDTVGMVRTIGVIRSAESRADSNIAAGLRICAAKLEAWLAVLQRRGDADDRIRRFAESIHDAPAMDPSNFLLLSTLHSARGDHRAALAAVQRREYHWVSGLFFLPPFLLQEARMARAVGADTTAIRAYQHYLALRTDPAPSLRSEVDAVRRELAEILGEPRRR